MLSLQKLCWIGRPISTAVIVASLAGCSSNQGALSDASGAGTETQITSSGVVLNGPVQIAAANKIESKAQKLGRRGAKPFDQPDLALEFWMDQRLAQGMTDYPVEQVRDASRDLELRQAEMMRLRAPFPGGITSWNEMGPGNIGGRTRAIVIDPGNANTMYAAGVNGGVWKTTDGGASWNPLDDFLPSIAVNALVMDPNNSNVLYAGTGEGYFNSDAARGLGIYKTTDAGATWTQLAGTVSPAVATGSFSYVNDLVISPNDSNRLYAACRTGVWRSLDAGATWSLMIHNPGEVTDPSPAADNTFTGFLDLEIRTDTNPDTVLATTGSFVAAGGLYRSTDSGVNWTKLGTAANLNRPEQGRLEVEIYPGDNDIMYVAMANNGSTTETGRVVDIYLSVDGGNNWTPRLNTGTPLNNALLSNIVFSLGCFGSTFSSQGWYDLSFKIDPTNANILYIGGIDLLRSDNAGADWGIASYWWITTTLGQFAHADHHTLVFHPSYDGSTNQTVFVGTDGGVFRSDNIRAATSTNLCPAFVSDLASITWTNLNNGYEVTQFYHGDSAKGADIFLGGCQDNGTNQVTGTANINGWISVFGGDGGYATIDPTNSNIQYLETQGFPTMQKSTDGGGTFNSAVTGITDTDGLFISPFEMDQSNPLNLYTGGRRAWRTTDGAASWQVVSPNFAGADQISAIAFAPSDSNRVYLGFDDGAVAFSSNALGAAPTWTVVDVDPGNVTFISAIAVDPTNPSIAYATTSTFNVGHIWRTLDGGATWTDIDGIGVAGIPDIPVHSIAVRPCDTQQLYAGTEVGVFASDDGGATWGPANAGLANTTIEWLDFQDDDTLVAFTHGRGAYITTLESCGFLAGNTCDTANEIFAGLTPYAMAGFDDGGGLSAPDGACSIVDSSLPNQWYFYTALATGNLTIESCDDGGPGCQGVDVFDGASCSPIGANIGCSIVSSPGPVASCGLGSSESITVPVVSGQTYLIRVTTCIDSQSGTLNLIIPPELTGDFCDNPLPIDVGQSPFDVTGFTYDGFAGTCFSTGFPNTWYQFTAPLSGSYTINACSLANVNGIELWTGCSCPPLAGDLVDCQGGNVPDTCGSAVGFASEITVNLVAGQCYLLRLTNVVATDTGTITITPPAGPCDFVNPSFDTGDFTGWTAADMAGPFFPLGVVGFGTSTGFFPWSSAPTDGPFAVFHGFDGGGPGIISVSQDLFVSEPGLSFEWRAAWDMLNFGGSTLPREFDVVVRPVGGGPELGRYPVMQAPPGTTTPDTGNKTSVKNLLGFVGQGVNISFEWSIPENFTGPAQFQFDNVCIGGFCPWDLTTSNTNPGDALFGVPDGLVNGADLSFYVENWLNAQGGCVPCGFLADVTTSNTNPGDPGYGVPDGQTNGADLSFYVEGWLGNCVPNP